MDNAELACMIITEYLEKHLTLPSIMSKKYQFSARSYQRWAADEIRNAVMDNPFDDPVSTICRFQLEMEYNKAMAKTDRAELMYNIAVDTAGDIMSLFL